ncbi:MAG: iron ABC transporter permease [Spirochaetales bacterium]|nr:iron ABC transporter permease [Spirochaetales bacterium]
MTKKKMIGSPSSRAVYRSITGRKKLLLAVLFLVTLLLMVTDIMTGPVPLSLGEVLGALFRPDAAGDRTLFIVLQLRLPVALMAVLAGGALSAAGAEMQTILNNPLASPFTMGISAAAGFGASLAIVFGIGLIPLAGPFLIPLNAFIFSLLTSILVLALSGRKGLTPESMVLAGIAVLFLFQAAMAVLEFFAAEEQLQAIVFWLFGSLSRTTWLRLGITAAVCFLVAPFLAGNSWKLTALRLGDTKARSLGINVRQLRFEILVLISLLTGTIVAFTGTIGFIGLAGPHIARMLSGEDQRYYLPVSVLSGSLILSLASILSKIIIPGTIFPPGVITSFIGVPFLLILLLGPGRRNR